MKSISLSLIILLLLLSCRESGERYFVPAPTVSEIDTTRVTIFYYNIADKECKKIFSAGKNSVLEDHDLIKIENALKQIIDRQNPVQVKMFKEYWRNYPEENYQLQDFIIKEKNYIRRYLVIKNARGEKEIYVSLICDNIAKDFDWKKYLSDGYGGGSCLFSFKLNFTTNKYYDVYFHDEA